MQLQRRWTLRCAALLWLALLGSAAHAQFTGFPGTVVRSSSFGVFVEIAPGVEGLCHNSEIPGMGPSASAGPRGGDRRTPTGDADALLPVGAEFDFKIIKMNEPDKKIGLSLKEMTTLDDLERMKRYQSRAEQVSSTVDSAIQKPATPTNPPSAGEPAESE